MEMKDWLDQLNDVAQEGEPVDLPELPENPDEPAPEAPVTQEETEEEEDDPQGIVLEEDVQTPEADDYKTAVDLVMCVDVTGSMNKLIDAVKEFAKSVPTDLVAQLNEVNRQTETMRVRVIAFRDFYWDYVSSRYPACEISRFFGVISGGEVDTDESKAFEDFVSTLEAKGGGREAAVDPESSLEALHLAFKSEWNNDPSIAKQRRIVMLFTDSVPHTLDDERRNEEKYQHPVTGKMGYPEDMPASMSALQDEYLEIGTNARLIVYARECEIWQSVGGWTAAQAFWNNDKGLAGIDKDVLYKVLKKSM